MEIFSVTGGSKWIGGWRNKDGWMSRASLSKWTGVKVDGGHVIELDLTDNNLQGKPS